MWTIRCHIRYLVGYWSLLHNRFITAACTYYWQYFCKYVSYWNMYERWYVDLSIKCYKNKICTEYRDMVPKDKAGLLGCGLTPGVPDKLAEGLSTMCQYSAQIFICLRASMSLFSHHLGVGLGPSHFKYHLTLPIVFRIRQSQKTIKSPPPQHPLHWMKCFRMRHPLIYIYAAEPMQQRDKINIGGKFRNARATWMHSLFKSVSHYTVFVIDVSNVELGQ